MQLNRDGLVPIGEPSPQARHHFTRADQVNLLVGARRAVAVAKQDRVGREVFSTEGCTSFGTEPAIYPFRSWPGMRGKRQWNSQNQKPYV